MNLSGRWRVGTVGVMICGVWTFPGFGAVYLDNPRHPAGHEEGPVALTTPGALRLGKARPQNRFDHPRHSIALGFDGRFVA